MTLQSVWSADSGELGLDLAQHHHPDLIIFDYALPGIDGVEMLEKIVQQQDLERTLTICVSALILGCDRLQPPDDRRIKSIQHTRTR
ncbi:MAG: response regulator [Cyanobacteria bacterium J06623_7]